MDQNIWAKPRDIVNIEDCLFYHTMDIPGHGLVKGMWDLRGKEKDYFANVDFADKNVLELGTASGHLCFAMEKMGARVTAYDLSSKQPWDIVPYADYDYEQHIKNRKKHIEKLNNGYWLAHKANNSQAKVVYGTVYDIPENIGTFDICTFGAILLHLRDPFLALQNVTKHVQETVIVTEGVISKMMSVAQWITGANLIRFLPNAKKLQPYETWWNLSPQLIAEYLRILGFPDIHVTYHSQLYNGKKNKMYTVVGHRR
ncbi:class I SAM-dependent methyltransferase [Candidatus Uabimicrobium amorphum]|uniref:Macrocin O-methyltransferase n=1 Tax=Uabimicrobium amorphum TaxID=2596890 RepID=A0A5S9F2U4_UABAM|nr:methyltransferase domain-containing protein [Candidatus Uabimicrobium amorphum]BBM82482.1 macrocin O-methyltransferase [Candidatus Uabimicrobium amorphum]